MAQEYPAAALEMNDESQTSALFGLMGMVWRHKWLLVLGLVIGLIVGTLYTAQLTPEYQSSLKLLVSKRRPEGLPGADPRNSTMEDYLATHQVVIRSPLVVGSAVTKAKLQALESLEKASDPTSEIVKSLTVSREATEGGATNILNLAYRSPVAQDCPKVLDAVMESYKEFLGITYQNVSDETLTLITKAKELLENRKAKKEKDYKEFRVTHPVLVRGKDGTNLRQDRLINIETKRSVLLVRRAEIEERLLVIEAAVKSGQDVTGLLVAPDQNNKPTINTEETLTSLRQQEQTLLEDFGPDHPQVRALRKRIETARADRSTKIEEAPKDPVKAYLFQLQRELEDVKTSEKAMSKLLQIEQADAQKMISYEIQDETFRKEIANEQQLFDGIVNRLGEINLFKDLGGYNVRCIAPATAAWKVGPRTVPIFLMASILGLVLGMGLAYLADATDQSFRNPEEIRRRLGMQIVGQIPVVLTHEIGKPVGEKGSTLAPILCTYYHPKSRNAEAYRGVRTGLFFSTLGKGHKVIQVTSPSAGDGKSTLAANLAISIAQVKKQVLLIDADFRRPTIHGLFGVSPARGLASVLLGENELADVIQPSGIANLSVLPCGPIPANPAELLSLVRFKELLDFIRERYDFVIIDTPPILAVTDPCMVVPHVDGVLLTLRPSKNAQPMAMRAKEVLATLDATMIGVVVNAIDDHSGGYGYGNYNYGYGAEEKYYQNPVPGAEKDGK